MTMSLAFLLSAMTSGTCVWNHKYHPNFAAYCKKAEEDHQLCKRYIAFCNWKDSGPPHPDNVSTKPSIASTKHSKPTTPVPQTTQSSPRPSYQPPHPDNSSTEPSIVSTKDSKPTPPVPQPPQPSPRPSPGGEGQLGGTYSFKKCVINIGESYDDVDIADNYQKYPNPFAFYTDVDHPGVTLIGKTRSEKCHWAIEPSADDILFTWNDKEEQCILNGSYGYFNPDKDTGSTGNPYVMNKMDRNIWFKASQSSLNLPRISGIPGEDGPVEVAIGYGHGVLNSKPGEVALVRHRMSETESYHYAAIMMVGTRAWSYEISSPANTHLAHDNYGGTCHIPDVFLLNKADVSTILASIKKQHDWFSVVALKKNA